MTTPEGRRDPLSDDAATLADQVRELEAANKQHFDRAQQMYNELRAAERVVGAARAVNSLNGIVFASDDKERQMLAQTVVRHILGTALYNYDRCVGEAIQS